MRIKKQKNKSHIDFIEKPLDGLQEEKKWKKIVTKIIVVFALVLITFFFLYQNQSMQTISNSAFDWYNHLEPSFKWIVLAGFLAQLVDGALGMGYGITSSTILLSTGINPAAISGSIHTAEIFASGASGYSHYKFGNVNKKLFKILVIPGVIGAILGAVLLVYIGEKHTGFIKIMMAIYAFFIGVKICINATKKYVRKKPFKQYGLLAWLGGFLDSFGGGGWGPIVTTTLITKRQSPRFIIGTVSLTEFFVTLSSALTFFATLGVTHWQPIIGLILGGVIASPIAAKLAGKLPRKLSFILLGTLVIVWSIRIIVKLF